MNKRFQILLIGGCGDKRVGNVTRHCQIFRFRYIVQRDRKYETCEDVYEVFVSATGARVGIYRETIAI